MKMRITYSFFLMAVMIIAIIEFPHLPLHVVTMGLRLMMIFILAIEMILSFKYCLSFFKPPELVKNMGLCVVTVIFTLLLLEAFFMFLPRTHGIGYSLANALWFDRYWKPFNSYGTRDLEPVKNKKTNIIFAGDSFAAGQGIKYIEDRFPDIVRTNLSKINENIQVINLAQTSLDTKSEFDSVKNFIESSGIHPDIIILQYYGNDIDHIAKKFGMRGDGEGFSPYAELNAFTRWILRGSYLFNYLYWMIPSQEVNGYLTYIEKAYADDLIFTEHMNEIVAFNSYAKARNTKFFVILFPLMLEIELSHKLYLDKITRYLKSKDIESMDLSVLFKDLPISDRIVNGNDAHPSLAVHRLVGEELTRYLSQELSK